MSIPVPDPAVNPESPPVPEIVVTDAPDAAFRQLLGDGLDAHNDAATGIVDRRPLAVLARDAEGRVVGGALGRTSLGLLFIDLFHLPKELRGRGIGSSILRAAEAEGRRRGCISGVLYTFSLQAPDFYEWHGWRRFGEIACLPAGESRVFMTKQL